MRRSTVALLLCTAAGLLGTVFFAETALCGMTARDAVLPGQPQGPEWCLSAPHPVAVLALAGALVGGVGVSAGRPWAALLAGLAVVAVGLLALASAGWAGIAAGALLVLGGIVARLPSGTG